MGSVMKRCLSYLIDARDCCLYWEMCFLTLPMPIVSTIWRPMSRRTLEKHQLTSSWVLPTRIARWSEKCLHPSESFSHRCKSISSLSLRCVLMTSSFASGLIRFSRICVTRLVGERTLWITFATLMRVYTPGMHFLCHIMERFAVTLQNRQT